MRDCGPAGCDARGEPCRSPPRGSARRSSRGLDCGKSRRRRCLSERGGDRRTGSCRVPPSLVSRDLFSGAALHRGGGNGPSMQPNPAGMRRRALRRGPVNLVTAWASPQTRTAQVISTGIGSMGPMAFTLLTTVAGAQDESIGGSRGGVRSHLGGSSGQRDRRDLPCRQASSVPRPEARARLRQVTRDHEARRRARPPAHLQRTREAGP